jgi:hypothetical protein
LMPSEQILTNHTTWGVLLQFHMDFSWIRQISSGLKSEFGHL